ncbi:methylmalonyl-CoA mutase family protein [Streptomyces sp. NPDC047061]|uniref:methylmalonyl-CoA mutase family protein n=1 Tax=Streptomyces sp. NPDC047061 TaxID=3154605 RepID=UPI0033FB8049
MNDVVKEYIARGTYDFAPKQPLRPISDILAYCHKELRRRNTIAVFSHHVADAAASPAL